MNQNLQLRSDEPNKFDEANTYADLKNASFTPDEN